MTEREQNPEVNREHIPTPEEILSLFRELSGKEFKETKRIYDEKGLRILEVEVKGESENEVVEYAYRRDMRYLDGKKTDFDVSEIHRTPYEDGIPSAGTSAARLVNGKWIKL